MHQWSGDEPLPVEPDVAQASDFLIELLRTEKAADPRYGCDVWLEDVIDQYLRHTGSVERTQQSPRHWLNGLAPEFATAAWELCRFGVLRPDGRDFGSHADRFLRAYTLTPFGKAWLGARTAADFVPTSLEPLSKLLDAFSGRFGSVYRERALDAARCYSAHAFFACCAMVGAASEAILLAVGSEKLGAEQASKLYLTGHGPSRLEKRILGSATDRLKRELPGHTGLIAVWRTYAAHASPANLTQDQAYTSLRGLLRFAHFADDNWQELTQKP